MQAVYVVAPDEGIRDALKTFLESFNIPVQLFSDAYEFLETVDGSSSGCVLVESELTGLNGLGLLAQLRSKGNNIPLFLLVNTATPEFTQRALANGACGVFEKPLMNDDIAAQLGPLFNDAWSRSNTAYSCTRDSG